MEQGNGKTSLPPVTAASMALAVGTGRVLYRCIFLPNPTTHS